MQKPVEDNVANKMNRLFVLMLCDSQILMLNLDFLFILLVCVCLWRKKAMISVECLLEKSSIG